MFKLLNTIIILLSIGTAFSQVQHSTQTIIFDNPSSTDWTLYFTDSQKIKIEYKFIHCDYNSGYDQDMILFRVTNLTTNDLATNWHAELYYEEGCVTCDKVNEYSYGLNLSGGEVVEGDCVRGVDHALKMFYGFNDTNYTIPDARYLTGFKLGSLVVTSAQ